MSFADSMDDLDAMNDPRNTAESVAAISPENPVLVISGACSFGCAR